ncbi:hypothetical protein [Ramlibacter tataouinensis]|nr:hypothetical protein [Ramlibacter tataouinensis]
MLERFAQPHLADDDDTLTRWAVMSEKDGRLRGERRTEAQPDRLIWVMLVALAFGPAIGYFLAQFW